MEQRKIPAVFMRGGTSKGIFFHAADLPETTTGDRTAWQALFLSVIGSPDSYGRQLNGMGGGISSLSKAVVIGPPSRVDADFDYTFAQVAVDAAAVDYLANCGNLSSAVGPFVIDEGLMKIGPAATECLVRIHNTNTAKIIHAKIPLVGNAAAVVGDMEIPGVQGTGAPIVLDFLDPAGAATGRLLPSAALIDSLDGLEVSMVDSSNPVAFVAATKLGVGGNESPETLEADTELMARLERLRRAVAVAMGLTDRPENASHANPKIAIVAPPADYIAINGEVIAAAESDILIRMVSMGRIHRAVALTSAMCLATATRIKGTLPHRMLSREISAGTDVRIGNPSGVIPVDAEVSEVDGEWRVNSIRVYRTARRLMEGAVLIPA